MNTSDAIRARRSIMEIQKETVIPKEHPSDAEAADDGAQCLHRLVPGNLWWWKREESGNRFLKSHPYTQMLKPPGYRCLRQAPTFKNLSVPVSGPRTGGGAAIQNPFFRQRPGCRHLLAWLLSVMERVKELQDPQPPASHWQSLLLGKRMKNLVARGFMMKPEEIL